jgi:hypothetical protein
VFTASFRDVRRRTLVALAAVIVVALAGAASGGARIADDPGFWSTAWIDPAGDSGAAPDIRIVQLGNNNDQNVLIRVYAPTKSIDPTDRLQVFVKGTSSSPGDPTLGGAAMEVVYDYADRKASAVEWDSRTQTWRPSIWSDALDQQFKPVLVTDSSTSFILPTGMLSSSELTGDIGVFVRLGTATRYDESPGTGFYTYNVHPLALKSVAFVVGDKRIGQRLILSTAVKRSDNHGYLTAGKITCRATSGSYKAHGASLGFAASGVPFARCGLKLSAALKGRRVEASISVAFAGRVVVRTTTFTAR